VKVGDLVKLNTIDDSVMFGRLGIVVELHNRVGPTAVVQWIGIEGAIGFRVKALEVVNESR
jgi:hypothetical protein